MNSTEIMEIAEKLDTALTTGNITALQEVCHEDTEIWHNFDDLSQPLREYPERLQAFVNSFSELAFKNRRRFPIENGYVQQHDLAGTLINGTILNNCPACFVVKVEAGKVTRLEEYIDPAPVLAALSSK